MENKSIKVIPDFLNELQAIDPRITIVENPNRPEVSNIKYDGIDVCPIPRHEIRDNPDPSYFIIAPNGWKMPHKSRMEAIGLVKGLIEKLKNPEESDIFYNK